LLDRMAGGVVPRIVAEHVAHVSDSSVINWPRPLSESSGLTQNLTVVVHQHSGDPVPLSF
jgi:hypothetical protein